jgi:hypothetical protein
VHKRGALYSSRRARRAALLNKPFEHPADSFVSRGSYQKTVARRSYLVFGAISESVDLST